MASSVGSMVALPAGLAKDTRDQPGNRSALIIPAAAFPLLAIGIPFLVDPTPHWAWFVVGLAVAVAWAVGASALAKSPKPWLGAVRLLVWAVLFVGEFMLVLVLFLPVAALEGFWWIGAIAYLVLVVATGVAAQRWYRR